MFRQKLTFENFGFMFIFHKYPEVSPCLRYNSQLSALQLNTVFFQQHLLPVILNSCRKRPFTLTVRRRKRGSFAGVRGGQKTWRTASQQKHRKKPEKNTIDLMSDFSRWWDGGRDGEIKRWRASKRSVTIQREGGARDSESDWETEREREGEISG